MSGRGQYFKNLYGGGRGRGRGAGNHSAHAHANNGAKSPRSAVHGTSSEFRDDELRSGPSRGQKRRLEDPSVHHLVELLRSLNSKSYSAYRDIQGLWRLNESVLHVEHIQSDAFAPPSKFRLRIPHTSAGFPPTLYGNPIRTTALCDFLARALYSTISKLPTILPTSSSSSSWSSAKGGVISIDNPGQQVLQRSSVVLDDDGIEARFTISLPASGRTILGLYAADIFQKQMPILERELLYQNHAPAQMREFVDCIEDQEALRDQVQSAGLVAFVMNGAILPRASGVSDLPLTSSDNSVIPFQSPQSLLRSFRLPHRGRVEGMAIPKGVTMIAGGGFHGKSTLLDALAHGCYNHIPGNGREFVVTSEKIVSLQSEDGRSIRNVDISPFIGKLPGTEKVTTESFRTEDASGSTSMAASLVEALELGADTLLFDEDSCATNFLIRDTRMQRLVKSDPIVPLIYNIRAMLRDTGVSSILVIGGCGDYCDVADLVLEMRDYHCHDITETARKVAAEIPSTVTQHEKPSFPPVKARHVHLPSLPEHAKLAVRRLGVVDVSPTGPHAAETLDLRALTQLVSESQTRGVAGALKALAGVVQKHELLRTLHREAGGAGDDEARVEGRHVKQWTTLQKATRLLSREIDERGLDCIMEDGRLDPFLARPRAIDVGLAINRLRSANLRYVTAHEDAAERPQ